MGMGGLIGSGNAMKTSALQSMSRYADLDQKIKTDQALETANIKRQAQSQNAQMATSAISMIGMALISCL